jgi:uncharacterized membrane protein
MFGRLKDNNRLYETIFLALSSLFCLLISVFRCAYTGDRLFIFLNWNLFLAFIPWGMTSVSILFPKIRNSKIKIFLLLISWLLFFPNAPYILTDLIHLRISSIMPIWYDLLLILSFAWTGLLFGFLSLWDIEQILGKFLKPLYTTVISTVLLFIGAFGIYIGRYLRWNSWDIITKPVNLIYDIQDRVFNPFKYPGSWGMTLFMGLFLNMLYWSFRLIRKRKNRETTGAALSPKI